jgi:hypothetical protein
MLVGPCIEVKAIEGFALHSDRDDGYPGAHFPVEAVLVHAEVARGVSEPHQSRHQCDTNRARALLPWGLQLEIELHTVPSDSVFRPTRTLRRQVLTHDT